MDRVEPLTLVEMTVTFFFWFLRRPGTATWLS